MRKILKKRIPVSKALSFRQIKSLHQVKRMWEKTPSDPSDPGSSGQSSDNDSRGTKSSKTKKNKSKPRKKSGSLLKAPALRNLPNPGAASAEVLAAKRQVREDILKEYHSPIARADYAKALDPHSLEELKLTLDSVKERQKFFAGKKLHSLYI